MACINGLRSFGHKSMSVAARDQKTRIHLDALARAELAHSFCREAVELAHRLGKIRGSRGDGGKVV